MHRYSRKTARYFVRAILLLHRQLGERALGKPVRICQGRIVAKDDLEVDDRLDDFAVLAERKIEVAALHLAHFRAVARARTYAVVGNVVVQIVHFHPAPKQVPGFLISGILYAVRQNFRQAVQHL
ncbi:hypothetical protein D3C77_403380 [compost metagenome]